MKTIGLIGGMSWESTQIYYRLLNERVKARLGGLHSARLVLYSVDFHDIEAMQRENRWDELGRSVGQAGLILENAGAELLLVCANTMHKVAGAIEEVVSIPLVHIADVAADAVIAAGKHRIGLLGTRYTMEQDFFAGRLRAQHGLDVLIPEESDRAELHRIVYTELCCGITKNASREQLRRMVRELTARGAEGIILGCTELGMLIGPADAEVPLFDTLGLHAERAVALALDD
jgi:aspartate racemase